MNLHIESEVITVDEDDKIPDSVIQLESVSVRYRVPKERFGTYKEYLIRRIQGRVGHEDFWALKDINISVNQGEVFGIIGRNGAGKSTLLKVVSRVLRPTNGRVRVLGRVAPLLELGAAFHHELTGHENVYLNAALLGHSQNEVDEKYQQITDFAEIGGFIDAPLRTFSTGMIARLGFSVATAWEPDILILDEVLAVGDEENGATVMLVSHNSNVINSICQRVAWIDQGLIKSIGDPSEVVELYHQSGIG
jgi:ABC-2 type transport system ATP-binding protein